MTGHREDILRRYAAGAELAQITADLGIDHEQTVEVVSSVGFVRSRAVQELRQLDAGPKAEAKAPRERPPVEPNVLTRATAAGGRFAAKAARIRQSLADLATELDEHADVIDAARKVDALKAELQRAAATLQALKPPKGHDNAEVRRWAKANQIQCPAVGRVPQHVIRKWRASQGGGAT